MIPSDITKTYNSYAWYKQAAVRIVALFYLVVTQDYNQAFSQSVRLFKPVNTKENPTAYKTDKVASSIQPPPKMDHTVLPAGSSAYQYQKCLGAFGKVDGNVRSLIQSAMSLPAPSTDVVIKLLQDDEFLPAEFIRMVEILKSEQDKLGSIALIESNFSKAHIRNFIREVVLENRALTQKPLKKRILEAEDPDKALRDELTQAHIIKNEIKTISVDDQSSFLLLKKLIHDESVENDLLEKLFFRLNNGDVYVWLQLSTIPISYTALEIRRMVEDEILNRSFGKDFAADLKLLEKIRERVLNYLELQELFVKLLTYIATAYSNHPQTEDALKMLDALLVTNDFSSYFMNVEILKLKKALLFHFERQKIHWSLFNPDYKVKDLKALWPHFTLEQQQEYQAKWRRLEELHDETSRQLTLKIDPLTRQLKQWDEELYVKYKTVRPYEILEKIALIPDSMLKRKLAQFFYNRFIKDNLKGKADLFLIDAEKFFISIQR